MRTLLFSVALALGLVLGPSGGLAQEKTVLSYNSIRDLLLLDPTNPSTTVVAEGLVSTGDNGGGVMRYYSDSSEATNAVAVFKPVNYPGRWKLILGGPGTNSGSGGGGSQTPWLQDINGNTFSLSNATQVQAVTLLSGAPTNASASAFKLGLYSGGGSNVARLQMGTNVFDLSTIGSVNQTPWVSDIDANQKILTNLVRINIDLSTHGPVYPEMPFALTNTDGVLGFWVGDLGDVTSEHSISAYQFICSDVPSASLSAAFSFGLANDGTNDYPRMKIFANEWDIQTGRYLATAPTLVNYQGGNTDGIYLMNPDHFFQVSSNYFGDSTGEVGSIVTLGAETGNAQDIGLGAQAVALIGDKNGQGHLFTNSYRLYGVGYRNFALGTNSGDANFLAFGNNNFEQIISSGSGQVASVGSGHFGASGLTSVGSTFSGGFNNFQNANLTGLSSVYAFGEMIGSLSTISGLEQSIIIGRRALYNSTVTDSDNFNVFGSNAALEGASITSSGQFTAIGPSVLELANLTNSSGFEAIGSGALNNATLANLTSSTFIGSGSGSSMNTDTLNNSVFIGEEAGSSMTGTNANAITAIGMSAMYGATFNTSTHIIAIGSSTGSSADFSGLSDIIMIGNGAIHATNSHDVLIGNDSNTYYFPGSGGAYFAGKVNAEGGIDPPYLLLDPQTRQGLAERVAKEVPREKGAGAALYFNQATKKLEYFVASEGNYYDLTGNVIESRAPLQLDTNQEQIKKHGQNAARTAQPQRRGLTNSLPLRPTLKGSINLLNRPKPLPRHQ